MLNSFLGDFVSKALNGNSEMNQFGVDIINKLAHEINQRGKVDYSFFKNIGNFLIILSEKSPKMMYENIHTVFHLIDCNDYNLRNSIIEIVGNLIVNYLCFYDNIEDVNIRTNLIKSKELFTECLFKRVYDKSSFCRAKVLKMLEKVCLSNAISPLNLLRLLNITAGRLKDEKSVVRKKALSLIGQIIIMYTIVFQTKTLMTIDEINTEINNYELLIKEESNKITKIQKELVEISQKPEENKRKSNMENDNQMIKDQQIKKRKQSIEEISESKTKHQMTLDHLVDYKKVITKIEEIVPFIIQLLGSKNLGDVQESITLMLILNNLGVKSSFVGIKKMLTLITRPDENITNKVMEAFSKIYFYNDSPNLLEITYIIQLTVTLNFSEISCLSKLIEKSLKKNKITEKFFNQIWKILLRNPEQNINKKQLNFIDESLENSSIKESTAALQLLNIGAEFLPNILLYKAELLIKHILFKLDKQVTLF